MSSSCYYKSVHGGEKWVRASQQRAAASIVFTNCDIHVCRYLEKWEGTFAHKLSLSTGNRDAVLWIFAHQARSSRRLLWTCDYWFTSMSILLKTIVNPCLHLSPPSVWMQRCILQLGRAPVSAAVIVTNAVMERLECCQDSWYPPPPSANNPALIHIFQISSHVTQW